MWSEKKRTDVKQISKVEQRRRKVRQTASEILHQMIAGEIEVYVGYRRLYVYWCKSNAAIQELKPMFRIPALEPDGVLSITDEFNAKIISSAREIVVHFQSD